MNKSCGPIEKIAFTAIQIDSLSRDLNILDPEDLSRAIYRISGACGYFIFIKINRIKIPDLRAARDNLSDILHHAKSLRAALGAAPLGIHYTSFEDHERLVDHDQAKGVGSEQLLLNNTLEILSGIVEQAKSLADNDEILRSYYLLPSTIQKNSNIETLYLWPLLINIYDEFRGIVAFSPDGPLVRYIATVHEALGLHAPSSSTIRIAVQTWKSTRDSDG